MLPTEANQLQMEDTFIVPCFCPETAWDALLRSRSTACSYHLWAEALSTQKTIVIHNNSEIPVDFSWRAFPSIQEDLCRPTVGDLSKAGSYVCSGPRRLARSSSSRLESTSSVQGSLIIRAVQQCTTQVQLKQEETDEAAALQELSSMGHSDAALFSSPVLWRAQAVSGEDSDEESQLSESSDEYMTKCSSLGAWNLRDTSPANLQTSADCEG